MTKPINISYNRIKVFYFSFLFLFIILFIFLFFNTNVHFQFLTTFLWSPNWGYITFSLDGISLFFIILSTLLVPLCILVSWESITIFTKEFYSLLFILWLLLILIFITLDLLIFYILFETILIPMFLLIGIWGTREEKSKAAYYFFFYTLVGSLLLLLSIFKIYSLTGTTHYLLLITLELPIHYQFWFFLSFIFSFAIKIPMIPVHLWLPQAHVEAPLTGSVLLAGILLKLGGYGFIRFLYPLFPLGFNYFTPFLLLLSLIAIIYGGLTTCRQNDMKRLIAYSSISHMGLVTLTIFTHSLEGLYSSIIMMLAHGLISAGLFIIVGLLYIRFHTRTIRYIKGIVLFMPLLSLISLILILSNSGFPLTLNFIAELFSLLSAFNYSYSLGCLTSLGVLITTFYSFYFFNRLFFGNISSYIIFPRDLNYSEVSTLSPLLVLTLILGLVPSILFNPLYLSCWLNITL
uniref:NADH dehydrogenase subunit 4 n=1 Tax=Craseoa lathetica TaxID=316205 RepID=UPI0026E2E3DB|nr:NADH dehydrogenase subunit 4 [Craseoa lathetica]WJJ70142.1 NADH dehydrogenase subunit 4 [Craseoa lathetica]